MASHPNLGQGFWGYTNTPSNQHPGKMRGIAGNEQFDATPTAAVIHVHLTKAAIFENDKASQGVHGQILVDRTETHTKSSP